MTLNYYCCCLKNEKNQEILDCCSNKEVEINVETCQRPDECKYVGRKILVCLPCPGKETVEGRTIEKNQLCVCLDPKTNTILPLLKEERPGAKRNEYIYRCESRELRAGNLYFCECIKRNGLQDDCRRTPCQGRSACLERPWPDCWPSGGCNGLDFSRPKQIPKFMPMRFDNKICEKPAE